MAVVAEPFEALVIEAVMVRLDSPELAAALGGHVAALHGEDLHDELADDEAHLDELAQAYGDKAITLREYLTARKPIEARIESARKRLSRVTGTTALDGFVGQAAQLRGSWNAMSIERRRALLGAVLDRLVIHEGIPGQNRFDPDRVEPVWTY